MLGIRRDQQPAALSEYPPGLLKGRVQLKMPDGFQKHHEIEAAGSERQGSRVGLNERIDATARCALQHLTR